MPDTQKISFFFKENKNKKKKIGENKKIDLILHSLGK